MGERHPQKQLWSYPVNLDKRVRSGAVALGGTIILEDSSITTSGDNAKGLHVLDANSTIFGTNLTITTSGAAASGAEADNGGLIELSGGTISTHGDKAFGLFGTDNGKVTAGGMTITTAGADAYGAFAQSSGTLTLNPGTLIQTSGKGSYGLYALDAGSITGNGVNVTTSVSVLPTAWLTASPDSVVSFGPPRRWA